jgi:hypothetical protein
VGAQRQHRHELGVLAPGVLEGQEEAGVQVVGAHRVHQQAHLDAFSGFFDQQVAEAPAGQVVAVDVAHHMHVVPGGADGCLHAIVGQVGVDEHLRPVSLQRWGVVYAGGHAGDYAGQVGHL